MGAHPPQDLINQETRKMSNKSVPPPFFCLLSSDADVQLRKVKTVLFLSMDNCHENSLDSDKFATFRLLLFLQL